MKAKMLLPMLALGIAMTALAGDKPKKCGTYKGHQLYQGEKGGCYYLKTKKKVKVYVDKKFCNC